MALVPIEGRECDGCTACCSFPPIRTETLQKPANTICQHCVEGKGCTIYEVRPRVCRGFFCGWFFIPELGPEWHPSNSGVVLRTESSDDEAVTLLILRLSSFLVSEEFAGMVGGWVAEGIGVEFERLGPPGHLPAKMRMNELLAEAVASRDLRAMQKVFAWSLAHIDKSHIWERDETVFRSALA
ncbi:MAG TPA: YkgJ family cysteine cluster protein [Devosia sp.]|nr:YkgJ family cysteine cluster protein [Devosia sp.]